MDWTLIGVDPAPSKETTLFDGTSFDSVAPARLSKRLAAKTAGNVLLAWDAPLSFSPKYGFYDRPIDRAIRRLIGARPKRVEPKAVAARAFAGCPHWAITCAVLGAPFGKKKSAWTPATERPTKPGRYLYEVNPSVAWAFWWIGAGVRGPMPPYKKREAERRALVRGLRKLDIPDEATRSDDTLDAWAAWRLLRDLKSGSAQVVGVPSEGAYLVPSVPRLLKPLESLLIEARGEMTANAHETRR